MQPPAGARPAGGQHRGSRVFRRPAGAETYHLDRHWLPTARQRLTARSHVVGAGNAEGAEHRRTALQTPLARSILIEIDSGHHAAASVPNCSWEVPRGWLHLVGYQFPRSQLLGKPGEAGE